MLHEAVCCQLLTKDIGALNFLSRCCTLLGVAYAGLMLLFFLPLFDYNISHIFLVEQGSKFFWNGKVDQFRCLLSFMDINILELVSPWRFKKE